MKLSSRVMLSSPVKPRLNASSIDMPERDVDVGHGDDEADRLVANFRKQCSLRHDERLHLVREVIEFGFGEWNKAPVLFPCLVVNGAQTPAFVFDLTQILRANRDAMPAGTGRRHFAQPLH